jgi:hypothetical protein
VKECGDEDGRRSASSHSISVCLCSLVSGSGRRRRCYHTV